MTFSMDPQAVEVLETVPKRQRSEYVSELIIDDGVDRGILVDSLSDGSKSEPEKPEKPRG